MAAVTVSDEEYSQLSDMICVLTPMDDFVRPKVQLALAQGEGATVAHCVSTSPAGRTVEFYTRLDGAQMTATDYEALGERYDDVRYQDCENFFVVRSDVMAKALFQLRELLSKRDPDAHKYKTGDVVLQSGRSPSAWFVVLQFGYPPSNWLNVIHQDGGSVSLTLLHSFREGRVKVDADLMLRIFNTFEPKEEVDVRANFDSGKTILEYRGQVWVLK